MPGGNTVRRKSSFFDLTGHQNKCVKFTMQKCETEDYLVNNGTEGMQNCKTEDLNHILLEGKKV